MSLLQIFSGYYISEIMIVSIACSLINADVTSFSVRCDLFLSEIMIVSIACSLINADVTSFSVIRTR